MEENIVEINQSSSQHQSGSPTGVDKGSRTRNEQMSSDDQSVDSLDPVIEPHSPNLVHPFTENKVNNLEDQEKLSTNIFKEMNAPRLVSSSSQTDVASSVQQTQTDFTVQRSKLVSDIGVLTDPVEKADKVTNTNLNSEKDHDNNTDRCTFPSFGEPVTEAIMTYKSPGLSSEPGAGLLDKKQTSDGTVGKKRNVWKKTLSFRASEEYESYSGENLQSEATRNSENYFIDGVTMHVK